MKKVLISFVAVFILSLPASADCIAHGQGKPGTRSEWEVSGVKQGMPCRISLYSSGPRIAFRNLEIVRTPKHGTVRVEGASLVYTPSARFAGKDTFFVKHHVEGSDGSKRRPSRMRFAVSG
jgi:hypothetical protein